MKTLKDIDNERKNIQLDIDNIEQINKDNNNKIIEYKKILSELTELRQDAILKSKNIYLTKIINYLKKSKYYLNTNNNEIFCINYYFLDCKLYIQTTGYIFKDDFTNPKFNINNIMPIHIDSDIELNCDTLCKLKNSIFKPINLYKSVGAKHTKRSLYKIKLINEILLKFYTRISSNQYTIDKNNMAINWISYELKSTIIDIADNLKNK